MSDYTPIHLPDHTYTSQASAAVTGGALVYVSGSGTVANTASAANLPIGAAANDAANGQPVGIYGRGTVHRVLATGAITAGSAVEAAATGTLAVHTVGTNDARVFGVALTTASGGAYVDVMEI